MTVPALFEHPGQERLDTVDRAPQVDVHHPAPVAVGDVGNRSGVSDPGVVEHQVHLAEQAEGFVGKLLDRLQPRDVADDAVRLDTVRAQLLDGRVKRGLIDVGQYDSRASPGELLCAGEPDTARTAGDHRSASLECLHGAKTIRPSAQAMALIAAGVSRSMKAAAYRCANAKQISGLCHASPPESVASQMARPWATEAR